MKSKRPSQDAPSSETKHELIAYQIQRNCTAPLIPAPLARKWMDDAPQKFPYRCLPLTMANQYGWEIHSTRHFRATWDGRTTQKGISVETLYGDGGVQLYSHFGSGVLTFTLPFLFRTPPGWNLMVRGPTNKPKDGLVALDGIVETDLAHSTFTMNWRFTRACTVEFVVGEPVCLLFPVQRGALEAFEGHIRKLKSDPILHKKYAAWSASRLRFNRLLKKRDKETVKQGWQKHYMKAAVEKKPRVRPIGIGAEGRSKARKLQ